MVKDKLMQWNDYANIAKQKKLIFLGVLQPRSFYGRGATVAVNKNINKHFSIPHESLKNFIESFSEAASSRFI